VSDFDDLKFRMRHIAKST